jgi:hypothetical protein
MPVSSAGNFGVTRRRESGEFAVVSNVQRPAMQRLMEGPVMLCSFTDQWRTPVKKRKGMTFKTTAEGYTGYGLYATVSCGEGRIWRDGRFPKSKPRFPHGCRISVLDSRRPPPQIAGVSLGLLSRVCPQTAQPSPPPKC